jgi:hypothetical protein
MRRLDNTIALFLLLVVVPPGCASRRHNQGNREPHRVAIPDAATIGSHIDEPLALVGQPASRCPPYSFPNKIELDVHGNLICGLTATYDDAVSFESVEAAIQEQNAAPMALMLSSQSPHDQNASRVWRLERKKLVISLDRDESAAIRLMYLPFVGPPCCNLGTCGEARP